MGVRSIVKLAEEKCDGCGLCVPACAEGAIQVIDGKARLVSEVYCDGLGACLGECPRGAITIEEREAASFDPEAVRTHLRELGLAAHHEHSPHVHTAAHGFECPGSAARVLERPSTTGPAAAASGQASQSELGNWPVQLRLVPVEAPWFEGARLLIAADCVPFAFPDFHPRLLAGRTLLIGCPKLDDVDLYRGKLAQIFARNDIQSVHVVHMEVPCCHGLVYLVQEALRDSGRSIPTTVIEVGVRGAILRVRELQAAAAR